MLTLKNKTPTKLGENGFFLILSCFKIRSTHSTKASIDLNLIATQLDKAHQMGLVQGFSNPLRISSEFVFLSVKVAPTALLGATDTLPPPIKPVQDEFN